MGELKTTPENELAAAAVKYGAWLLGLVIVLYFISATFSPLYRVLLIKKPEIIPGAYAHIRVFTAEHINPAVVCRKYDYSRRLAKQAYIPENNETATNGC